MQGSSTKPVFYSTVMYLHAQRNYMILPLGLNAPTRKRAVPNYGLHRGILGRSTAEEPYPDVW